MISYLPVILFAALILAALFACAGDRAAQLTHIAGLPARMRRRMQRGGGTAAGDGIAAIRNFSPARIVFYICALFILLYVWTYQRAQDAVAAGLANNGVEEVAVGSLIIPWSAFFRGEYIADAGFAQSKKRTRVDVTIRGRGWQAMHADIDEAGLAKIASVTGQKFVFSYLTDVKILRPVIEEYMMQLVRGGQIAKYEIETFDNRGPYLLVALPADAAAGNDTVAVADELAAGLYTNLTKTNQLKVNQVVMKVVEAAPYIADGSVSIIARGTAGNY